MIEIKTKEGIERLEKLLEYLKEREKLLREYFRNETDINRLKKANEDIMKRIRELDSMSITMYKFD